MELEDVGWLILRIGFAALFLYAAWTCGKNSAARQWTIEETAILVGKHSRVFALGGIAVMGVGGLFVLLGGLFGRAGGAMIAAFLFPGAIIHFRQMRRVDNLTSQIRHAAPELSDELLTTLNVSARLGHYSSALKNFALAAVAVFILLVGTGPRFNLFP